jgi:predicted site-specific integrase-resolvase
MTNDLYTPNELAIEFGVSFRTLRRWECKGIIVKTEEITRQNYKYKIIKPGKLPKSADKCGQVRTSADTPGNKVLKK